MVDAGARRVTLSTIDPAPAGSTNFPVTSAVLRAGGAAGLCALLAACSAHERSQTSAATPTTLQPVALAAPATPGEVAPSAGASTPAATTAAAPSSVAWKTAARTPAPNLKLGRSGGGLASWYGDRFHGRATANGERFNMATLTAAHRSFPLPSYVRVTNASNGRSIVVRVNDRGPYHGNRVIDVSRQAADVLGFRGNGVGNVKLDYIGPAPKSGSDDRKLLASYQEFGRPSVAPGAQIAALAPVSDADLARETSGGGAYALASAAVGASASAISYSAAAVTTTAKAAASSATAAVRSVLPGRAAPAPAQSPVAVASATPGPTEISAYASPPPTIAGAPAAIVDPAAAKARRVIVPTEPALASATPAIGAGGAPDISSRIASSFEGFGGASTQVSSGGSVAFEATR